MDEIERHELLDRYLDAVSRQLPRRNRADVTRELRETLVSDVQDRELQLGRHLSGDEIADLVTRYGRPDVIARNYGPQRALIGPDVFPDYLFAVRLTLLVIAIPTTLSVILAATSADTPIVWPVVRALWQWLQIAVLNVAGITLVFAWGERRSHREVGTGSWDPRDLPETSASLARLQTRVSRSQAVGSLTGMAGMLLWWLGANALLWRWVGWSPLPVEWSPIWTDLTLPAVVILSAAMARVIVVIVRPRLMMFYLVTGLALNMSAVFVVITLLRAGSWVEATASTPPGAALLLQGMIVLALTVILVVVVADTLIDGRRLVMLTRARRPVAA